MLKELKMFANLTLKTASITMDKEMFHQTCAQPIPNPQLHLAVTPVNLDTTFHITKIYTTEPVLIQLVLMLLKSKPKS